MFIVVNQVEAGPAQYNEDTGREEVTETSKPTLVNSDAIRCLYGRRDHKPGTRITFMDGGGFAVTETPDAIAAMIAGGDVGQRLALALAPPQTEAVS